MPSEIIILHYKHINYRSVIFSSLVAKVSPSYFKSKNKTQKIPQNINKTKIKNTAPPKKKKKTTKNKTKNKQTNKKQTNKHKQKNKQKPTNSQTARSRL